MIGAGQAGGPLATALANAGRKTALIEREHAGGTCINEGCTPTKTMIASARVAYLARRGADYGVQTGEITMDHGQRCAIENANRRFVPSGSESASSQTKGSIYLRGEARFTGPKTLHIQLNDGGKEADCRRSDRDQRRRATQPSRKSPALNSVPHLNSTTIMELSETPEHLLVLGGGNIGLEFGQMFRRFGSRVTIVQRGPKLLAARTTMSPTRWPKSCEEDGVSILMQNERRKRPAPMADSLVLGVTQDGRRQSVTGSHLLIAAGRTLEFRQPQS